MIVETKGNAKKDPELEDLERDYMGRVVGLFHMGKVEAPEFDNNGNIIEGKFKVQDQCVIMFELLEEDTMVERGKEGEEKMVRRTIPQFMTFSSNEKSGLFKLCKKLGKTKAAWVEGKQGKLNTLHLVNKPLQIGFKKTQAGNVKIDLDRVAAIPPAMIKSMDQAESKLFHYSPQFGGAFNVLLDDGTEQETSIEDVPAWLIKKAVEDVINLEEFSGAEELITYAESLEDGSNEGTDNKANGVSDDDAKKADDKAKADAKAAKEAEAKAKAEAEAKAAKEAKAEEEPAETPAQKRARLRKEAAAKKAAEEAGAVEYPEGVSEDMTAADLEEWLVVNKETADDVFDDLIVNHPEEADYKAELLKLTLA